MSFRTLIKLCGAPSRTGRALISSDKSQTRRDVRKILNGTTSLDPEYENDQFVSSAYNVDKKTLQRMEKDIHNQNCVNPRDTTVILFPGQGSQYPGMAKKLKGVPGVKEMFDYASEVMNLNLLKLCCEGPERLLTMTINCQVAVLVTSLAALEKLKYDNPRPVDKCAATAGFSVGEYAALVFSGAMTFEEAVQVVKLRGEAMQSCSTERQSGLLVTFAKPETNINYVMKLAREWCSQKENIQEPVCEVSNFLFPDCKVIGGDMKAISFVERNARDFGIWRTKRLPVSGAFHTRLMKPAKSVVRKALDQVDLKSPAIQVVSNFSATPYQKPDTIRKALAEHVCSPVLWEQSMHQIFSRDQEAVFPDTFEVGPGNTLRPMLRAVNQKAYKHSFKVDI